MDFSDELCSRDLLVHEEPLRGLQLHPCLAGYVLHVCIHLSLVFNITTEVAQLKALFRWLLQLPSENQSTEFAVSMRKGRYLLF